VWVADSLMGLERYRVPPTERTTDSPPRASSGEVPTSWSVGRASDGFANVRIHTRLVRDRVRGGLGMAVRTVKGAASPIVDGSSPHEDFTEVASKVTSTEAPRGVTLGA